MAYALCLVLFCIGLYGVLRKRNVIKMIIGLIICEYSANLFFIMMGYRTNGRAPIMDPLNPVAIENMVDPLPQSVVLTTIVIGLATTILLVALAVRIFEKFKTFDITQIRELKG
jgi:multicomponent Na+:H+ antiporter subunit C